MLVTSVTAIPRSSEWWKATISKEELTFITQEEFVLNGVPTKAQFRVRVQQDSWGRFTRWSRKTFTASPGRLKGCGELGFDFWFPDHQTHLCFNSLNLQTSCLPRSALQKLLMYLKIKCIKCFVFLEEKTFAKITRLIFLKAPAAMKTRPTF